MTDAPKDIHKLFEVWMDSEEKALITVFFSRNPGVVETLEGLARRLGTSPDALKDHVRAHIELGLLTERKVGGKTLLVFDSKRRRDFEQFIQEEIQKRMRGAT